MVTYSQGAPKKGGRSGRGGERVAAWRKSCLIDRGRNSSEIGEKNKGRRGAD